MTLLAVGIGNTTTQFAAYEHLAAGKQIAADAWPEPARSISLRTPELLAEPRCDGLVEQVVAALAGDFGKGGEPLRWCVASVHRAAEKRLEAWVARHRPADVYGCLSHADLPLRVAVEQPERVGMDRLVAAVAANRLREAGRAAIVVDAGTAVTIDLVDAAGTFQGGVILPGLAMTARALSLDTDALPLVAFPPGADPPAVVGKSTDAAIRSGLFWGTVGAVRECVARISRELSHEPQLFVTGGDARRMAPLLGGEARFVEQLVPGGVALAALAMGAGIAARAEGGRTDARSG